MAIKIVGAGETGARPKGALKKTKANLKKAVEKIAAVKEPKDEEAGKVLMSIRLDKKVVDYFKVGGIGWQSRINTALRKIAGLE